MKRHSPKGGSLGLHFASLMVSTNQNRLVLMSLVDSDNDTRWVGQMHTEVPREFKV